MKFKRIRNLREDKDLKQKKIASYLNITQQQYSLYEKGIREIPIDLLIKLADYHKVSIDYLVDRTDKKNL